jgi:GntR family transcriptional regulator/MocR family aminotransferase
MNETSRPWEVLLHVDRGGDGTLRAQLQIRLREAIASGALAPGERLPSTRSLSGQIGVSRGVVIDTYEQLAIEGFVELRERAAPRVAPAAPTRAAHDERPPAPGPRFDFSATSPDIALFPRQAWRRELDRALATLPDSALDYGDPRGAIELRTELSRYLGRVRGVVAPPEAIVIVNGFTQGLDLMCRLLAARGARTVALEDPCLEDIPLACARSGLRAHDMPVDDHGARIEGIATDVAIVSPSHQYPAGAILAGDRRQTLLAWAAAAPGRFVIEDDYDAEFRYDRRQLPALQASAPEHVVYTGTTSKTFAPGLRLGWLVVPAALIDAVTELKWFVDGGAPALGQHAYAALLRRGIVDRHLQRARDHYRKRRDLLVAELAQAVPEGRVEGIAAGLHLVLRLPRELDGDALARAAEPQRVRVDLLGAHGRSDRACDALVLGFGAIPTPAIRAAVNALAAALRDT